jgi:hypothetical protein
VIVVAFNLIASIPKDIGNHVVAEGTVQKDDGGFKRRGVQNG